MLDSDLTDSIDDTIWNTIKKDFNLDDYEFEEAKFLIVREVIKQIHHL